MSKKMKVATLSLQPIIDSINKEIDALQEQIVEQRAMLTTIVKLGTQWKGGSITKISKPTQPTAKRGRGRPKKTEQFKPVLKTALHPTKAPATHAVKVAVNKSNEAPKTARELILACLSTNPKTAFNKKELKARSEFKHLSPISISVMLLKLTKTGQVRRAGPGKYVIA